MNPDEAATWDPERYARFRAERSQPFFDLLALVSPIAGGRALDLGCGTGELTAELHRRLGAAATLGIDSAPRMLAEAVDQAVPGLEFALADIATFEPGGPYDLVFSNAALQWLPDHERLFRRLAAWVAPGGQLAVQMPANQDHPSHALAAAVAAEPPFAAALGQPPRATPVQPPEAYASWLDALGFSPQHVRLQVYAHHLPDRDAVVTWVQGTLLTWYEARLGPERYAAFLDRYRERLRAALPDERPFFYPFKRMLLWARRP
jgi:trans-aconitate 2-methyltransferase